MKQLVQLLERAHYRTKEGVRWTDFSKVHGFRLCASTTNGTSGIGIWKHRKVYFRREGGCFKCEQL